MKCLMCSKKKTFILHIFLTRFKLDNEDSVATLWFPCLSIYHDIVEQIVLHDVVVCRLVANKKLIFPPNLVHSYTNRLCSMQLMPMKNEVVVCRLVANKKLIFPPNLVH